MPPVPDRMSMYERWMKREGVPVVRSLSIDNVRDVELGDWARLGGRGAYLELKGMEGLSGMYLVEIPPGGSLEPEHHLYDEIMYVVEGRGSTEVWSSNDSSNGEHHYFEWQTASIFAPPMNTWHRLNNLSGTKPALVLGITNAPLALDLYQNAEFIYSCDWRFTERFDGRKDYFREKDERWKSDLAIGGKGGRGALSTVWETNLVADVRNAEITLQGSQTLGKLSTALELSENVLGGHVEDWPPGLHDMAHYHLGGAIIVGVSGQGYTLMWPQDAGIRPYESGNAHKVVRVDWHDGTVFSPPTNWFHQHFNAGSERFRFFASHPDMYKYAAHFWEVNSGKGLRADLRDGGTQIGWDDQDPEIQKQFREHIARLGVTERDPFVARLQAEVT